MVPKHLPKLVFRDEIGKGSHFSHGKFSQVRRFPPSRPCRGLFPRHSCAGKVTWGTCPVISSWERTSRCQTWVCKIFRRPPTHAKTSFLASLEKKRKTTKRGTPKNDKPHITRLPVLPLLQERKYPGQSLRRPPTRLSSGHRLRTPPFGCQEIFLFCAKPAHSQAVLDIYLAPTEKTNPGLLVAAKTPPCGLPKGETCARTLEPPRGRALRLAFSRFAQWGHWPMVFVRTQRQVGIGTQQCFPFFAIGSKGLLFAPQEKGLKPFPFLNGDWGGWAYHLAGWGGDRIVMGSDCNGWLGNMLSKLESSKKSVHRAARLFKSEGGHPGDWDELLRLDLVHSCGILRHPQSYAFAVERKTHNQSALENRFPQHLKVSPKGQFRLIPLGG